MSSISADQVRELLERLAGQTAPLTNSIPDAAIRLLEPGGAGLGHSQLNELLILLGFDRVTRSFFQYLVDGETTYQPGATIASLSALESGVDRFRKAGLLLFGNVKFAFKNLSRDATTLRTRVESLSPVDASEFTARHEPVQPIEAIPGNRTHYLGYIIQKQIHQRLEAKPDDSVARNEEQERMSVVDQGRRNHKAYLASDHLDVYVATSMRDRHEYVTVGRIANEIFSHPELSELKLRWFDPTQAYCPDRIDKGLAEALMLRRAYCTIYFAQEADTLGKDSELASTLAQGKPVIAFVPEVDPSYAARLLNELRTGYPELDDRAILLK